MKKPYENREKTFNFTGPQTFSYSEEMFSF